MTVLTTMTEEDLRILLATNKVIHRSFTIKQASIPSPTYNASLEFDDSAESVHGIINIGNDIIDFYGTTLEELKKEFKISIEEYIAFLEQDEAK